MSGDAPHRQGSHAAADSLPVVVFLIEDKQFALHLPAVERVLPMVAVSPLPGGPAVVAGAISLQGRIVPVFDVRRRIGFPERDYGPDAHLLVARARQREVALPVDEVVGVRSIAGESVTAPEDVVPGLARLSGVAAVEDGILVIHDLDAFLSGEEEAELDRALDRAEA